MPGYNSQRRGTARTLPKLIVLSYVLFVCKCVLYYCHRVATQLQLTNISYHISTQKTRQTVVEGCRSQLGFISVCNVKCAMVWPTYGKQRSYKKCNVGISTTHSNINSDLMYLQYNLYWYSNFI